MSVVNFMASPLTALEILECCYINYICMYIAYAAYNIEVHRVHICKLQWRGDKIFM